MEAWATPPAAAFRACLHFVIAAKPSRVRPDGRSSVPPPWRGARLGGASHAALRQRRIRSRRHTGRYRRGWTPRFQGTSMASMTEAERGGHTSTVCRNARAYGLADYLDASLPTKMVAFASRLRGGDKLVWVSEKRKKIVLGPAVVALDDYHINEVTSSCKVREPACLPPLQAPPRQQGLFSLLGGKGRKLSWVRSSAPSLSVVESQQ